MDFNRFPLLLITAVLLIGGVVENEGGAISSSLLAVGFICLGSWLTIEVQTWHQRLRLAWEAKNREWLVSDALPKVIEAYEEDTK
jgi:hypothetical protein